MQIITETSASDAKGLYLLFAKGKRPDRAAIREFVANQIAVNLTHDPADDSQLQLVAAEGEVIKRAEPDRRAPDDVRWLELLRDGLMFDLRGLSDGEAISFPEVEFKFDLEEMPRPVFFEALQLTPGHHLAGGERTMPVAKGLIALARDLVHHFDEIEAIVWPHSSSAIGPRFFESVATSWLDGGPFPALGLTAFRETIDGALQSIGLNFWIDRELRIELPLSKDKISATRLAVRIVNQLVLLGGIDGNERVAAPDGSLLIMRTSRNGKFIRVWRE